MQKKIFFLILLIITFKGFSQTNAKEKISINTEIVGKGNEKYCKVFCEGNNYFIKTTIKNNEDSSIYFYQWSCSWQSNWFTNNDSVYVKPVECDANTIERITLLPKQTVTFYGIVSTQNQLEGRYFKLGFIYLRNWNDCWNFDKKSEMNSIKNVYWSNSILLRSINNTYEIN
ncbi:MAG: hypothetical protein ABJA78_19345 [Ferruginibacter sp.]